MHLSKVSIKGYRSIKQSLDLPLEPNVTVILGANDHGKSNLLSAIKHLDSASPFTDEDLSWDLDGQGGSLPEIHFDFIFSTTERESLLEWENAARSPTKSSEAINPASESGEQTSTEQKSQPPEPVFLKLKDIPAGFTLKRIGVKGELTQGNGLELYSKSTKLKLFKWLPRVEIIRPWGDLVDSIKWEEIAEGENEFMQGILYYAGIVPSDAESLFEQTDATTLQLERASGALNKTLRESWSQGKELRFVLQHNSKDNAIELLMKDPSVQNRFVRASKRSSGFTHYFALKTILYARERRSSSSSFIWLFDEPGIYLHPAGQHDLLRVLEALGKDNQLIYVTHSLFMINKNHPARHRLILKGTTGTVLDVKPYVGKWGTALDSLGMSLAGTILFANHVLLVEGDSDPIYIHAVLQKLVDIGKIQCDLNAFVARSTQDCVHAHVMLDLLLAANPKPVVALLVDGDKAGKDRAKYLKPYCSENAVEILYLDDGADLEDYLPAKETLFIEAVFVYVEKVLSALGKQHEGFSLEVAFAHFRSNWAKEAKGTSLVDWAKSFAESTPLASAVSKVGIAREYAKLLDNAALSSNDIRPIMKIVKRIIQVLELPNSETASNAIFEDSDEDA
ncbi:MAG: AAA family ATPase [bacterium]